MLATQSDMPIFTVVLNQLVRQLASILHKYCATTVLFFVSNLRVILRDYLRQLRQFRDDYVFFCI